MPIYPVDDEPNEGSSAKITFYIRENKNDATSGFDLTEIATATYTLTDLKKGDIINSRENVDFRSGSDGSIATTGGLATVYLLAADNIIISNKLKIKEEVHVMTVTITTTTSPVQTLVEDIYIRVKKLR